MTSPRPHRAADDAGVVTTEMVIILPVLIGFLFLVVLAGRLVDARSDIVGAANDAARAASLQVNAASAQVQAERAAADTVSGERLRCAGGPDVQVGFMGSPETLPSSELPGDDPPNLGYARGGTVWVRVTCEINTSDLSFIGVGPSVTYDEVAWEPMDPNRSE